MERLQIDKQHERLGLAGRRVTLRELSDGDETQALWQGQLLSLRRLAERPKQAQPKPVIVNNRQWKPPPTCS